MSTDTHQQRAGDTRPSARYVSEVTPGSTPLLMAAWLLLAEGTLALIFLPVIIFTSDVIIPPGDIAVFGILGICLLGGRHAPVLALGGNLVDRPGQRGGSARVARRRQGLDIVGRGLHRRRPRDRAGPLPDPRPAGGRQTGFVGVGERTDPVPAEGHAGLGGHVLHDRALPGAVGSRWRMDGNQRPLHRVRTRVHDRPGDRRDHPGGPHGLVRSARPAVPATRSRTAFRASTPRSSGGRR